ncbi:MAG: C4-dicarboxylate ABC transporter permease, partial [Pseudomonadota bacterium]
YKGVVPFIALQLLALVIVGSYPPLVNYLPTRLSLTGETAPPPKNPRLQQCIEEHVFAEYAARGDAIQARIAEMQRLDASDLPQRQARALDRGLKAAEKVFVDVQAVRTAQAAVDAATPAYAPLHAEVRAVQGRMRRYQDEIAEAEQILRRRGIAPERRVRLEARIAEEKAEIKELRAQIPAGWEEANKAFSELRKAELGARRTYRRTAESAYEPIADLTAALAGTDQLAALRPQIVALASAIGSDTEDQFSDKARALRSTIRDIEGTSDIARALNRARRAYPDKADEARQRLDEALEALNAGIAWRRAANAQLGPQLSAYRAEIADTIGLRNQDRLPPDTALAVAACQAQHRDISLSF